jgi:MFS family permease
MRCGATVTPSTTEPDTPLPTRLLGYTVAATLARLADEMVGITVVLLVLARTGNDTALAGAAVAGYTLPAVLTGPLLGAWLGHARRPKLALAGNELLLALVAFTLVAVVGHVPGVVVVGLTALAGLSLPMTSGGFSSLVPRLTHGTALSRANTVDALTFNTAAMGGPAVGGVIASVFGAGTAVVVLGCCALAAIAATLAIPVAPADRVTTEAPALLATARAGLRHLAATPPLRGATVASVGSLGCVGMLVVALPQRSFDLGVSRGDAGFLWAAVEVGCALAVVTVNPWLRRWRPERTVFVSVALYGLAVASWALAGSFALILALSVVAGFMVGPTLPAVFASRQRYTPAPLLAQVSTTGASLKIGGFAVGSAVSGVIVPVLGPTVVILLVAAGQLAAATLGWLAAATPAAEPARAAATRGRYKPLRRPRA